MYAFLFKMEKLRYSPGTLNNADVVGPTYEFVARLGFFCALTRTTFLLMEGATSA